MEISIEQIIIFIVLAIIGTILYVIIYNKKGSDKNIQGYIGAIKNCLGLAIVLFFIVIGIEWGFLLIKEQVYAGLIVPLGWFIIAYNIIKNILNKDFNLNIHIFNQNTEFWEIAKQKVPEIMLTLGSAIVTLIVFFIIVPDTENQKYGPVPLIIVGIICLIFTVVMGLKLFGKLEENNIDMKQNKTRKNPIVGILLVMCFLMGTLFLSVKIGYDNSHKGKNYIPTQGKYVDAKIQSKNSGKNRETTYYLIYSYEVDGKEYRVSTDGGTSYIPEYGSEKIVLYNQENPSDAYIKGENNTLYLFATVFMGVPLIALVVWGKKKIMQNRGINE